MPVLVVGAGFSGATLARECAEAGLKVIVIEARSLARSAVAALRMGQRPPVFAPEVETCLSAQPILETGQVGRKAPQCA